MRLLPVIFILLASSLSIARGPSISGGGNASVSEFFEIGEAIISSLLPNHQLNVAGHTVDFDEMTRLLSATKVDPINAPLFLDGSPVDAINYPEEKRIELSELNWEALPPEQKSWLVIHEILGLMRIPDVNFSRSRALIDFALRKGGLNPKIAASKGRCAEKREFVGPKAKELISALLLSGIEFIEADVVDHVSFSKLSCTEGYTALSGLPSGNCSPEPEEPSKARLVMQALLNMGAEDQPGMGQTTVQVKDLYCEREMPNLYKCSLYSDWIFGCD